MPTNDNATNDNEGTTISESLRIWDEYKAGWKEIEQELREMGMLTFEERLEIKENLEYIESMKAKFIEKYC